MENKTVTFLCNRLARDKVVENFESTGASCKVSTLSPAEHTKALEAKTRDERIAELADLHEILACLQKLYGITREEVQEQQDKKNNARGSMADGIFLKEFSMTSDHKLFEYFAGQPERYPKSTNTQER